MRIEDLKRWHWIILGLIAGLVLAQLYSSMEPGRGATMAQLRFERFVHSEPFQGQHPWLLDVRVYPPRGGITTVTGRFLEPRGNQTAIYRPFRYRSAEPYVPLARPRGNQPPGWDDLERQTVREYVEYHSATNEHFTASYVWIREPLYLYLIWTGATVLVIGGIWPTVVNVLTGAGLGRRSPPPPEPEYDLDRFHGGEEPDWQPQKKEMTQDDLDQLKAVEAELERKLAAHDGEESAAEQPQQSTEQPARQLDGEALEPAVARHQSEADKAYGGEFYPTVAHAPKKKGE